MPMRGVKHRTRPSSFDSTAGHATVLHIISMAREPAQLRFHPKVAWRIIRVVCLSKFWFVCVEQRTCAFLVLSRSGFFLDLGGSGRMQVGGGWCRIFAFTCCRS